MRGATWWWKLNFHTGIRIRVECEPKICRIVGGWPSELPGGDTAAGQQDILLWGGLAARKMSQSGWLGLQAEPFIRNVCHRM